MHIAVGSGIARIVHKLTPAKAHDWGQCGGFFEARHLSGVSQVQSYQALLGTAVHELAAVYDQRLSHGDSDIKQVMAHHWRPGRFIGVEDVTAREEARLLLECYALERIEESVHVLASECFTQTMRQALGAGHYIVLSGRMDRVARREDGTIEVLDLKTGGLPTEDELRRDPATTIYHLMAAERFVAVRIVIAQLSLRTRARVEVALTAEDIGVGKEALRAMARDLASNSFGLTPGTACAFCPACDQCSALRRDDIGIDDEIPW